MAHYQDQVTEIEGLISRYRADQRAWTVLRDAAVSDEVRAMELLDAARALQTRADDAITADGEEIDRLTDELGTLIPHPRKASE